MFIFFYLDNSTLSAPELLSLIFDLEDGVVGECEIEEKEG